MTASLFLTGALGLLQERTYSVYGPYWREGVFYTVRSNIFLILIELICFQHLLSLPIFIFLGSDVRSGFQSLSAHTANYTPSASSHLPAPIAHYTPYIILALNLVTQLMCVSAVNQLTSVRLSCSICLIANN